MTKQGLDASGHLLLAEGHLRKAKGLLSQEPPSRYSYHAFRNTAWAILRTRFALKRLAKLKEEPCKP